MTYNVLMIRYAPIHVHILTRLVQLARPVEFRMSLSGPPYIFDHWSVKVVPPLQMEAQITRFLRPLYHSAHLPHSSNLFWCKFK
jgi:hypothetical protein